MVEYKLPRLFYIEHKLTIINFFLLLCDFLVKFVTCYIKIHQWLGLLLGSSLFVKLQALLLGSKAVRRCLVGFYVIQKTSGLSRTLALLGILHRALQSSKSNRNLLNIVYYKDSKYLQCPYHACLIVLLSVLHLQGPYAS